MTAYPRFFELDESGDAHLNGDDRGYHAGTEVQSSVYTVAVNEHYEVTIDGKTEPEPVDPGPTPEEIAEREKSDRQMAAEREAHERGEQAIRDEASRLNRENDERLEQERRAQEEEQRRKQAEADERARVQREENARLDQEAAAERERLGIKGPGDITDALYGSSMETSEYLSLVNLWSAQYAPDDVDGFKARIREILHGNSEFSGAVNEVCRRLGWTM